MPLELKQTKYPTLQEAMYKDTVYVKLKTCETIFHVNFIRAYVCRCGKSVDVFSKHLYVLLMHQTLF